MTKDEEQRAQDLIASMELQRNEALAKGVYLQADLMAANRRIAELEKAKPSEEPELPLSNGHAQEARASA